MSTMSRVTNPLRLLLLLAAGVVALATPAAAGDAATSTVVFICEHGSAKSLVATELFNRLASQRGLAVRAISRAVSAQTVDTKVPPALARSMSGDGFSVERFQPQPVSAAEVKAASRVIVVNYDGDVAAAAGAPVEHWNIGPAVTLEYQNARQEISTRIDALVESLKAEAK